MRIVPITQDKKFSHIFLPYMKTPVRCSIGDKRVYVINNHILYSVTTVLSCRGKTEIDNWKNAVGESFARRISHVSSTKGSLLHEFCEYYLTNKDVNPIIKNDQFAYVRYKQLIPTLNKIDNVYCIERPLFSLKMKMAGTVDCIAEYDGVLSVIDFKTSKKIKGEWEIPHYFAQTAAYAIMFEEMYNIKVRQLVIIMSIEGISQPSIFISEFNKHTNYLKETIQMFRKGLHD